MSITLSCYKALKLHFQPLDSERCAQPEYKKYIRNNLMIINPQTRPLPICLGKKLMATCANHRDATTIKSCEAGFCKIAMRSRCIIKKIICNGEVLCFFQRLCCVRLACQPTSQQYCSLILNQHQPPAIIQSVVLFSHNKSAPVISHSQAITGVAQP